jgi:predicted DNA-binding transcriptional regulator AlpA
MATVNKTVETLLNEHDVARITGMSVATVRRWRLQNRGPRYLKLGASIRYPPQALAAWLKSRPMGGETERDAESEC